jgi:hypothetical protein
VHCKTAESTSFDGAGLPRSYVAIAALGGQSVFHFVPSEAV